MSYGWHWCFTSIIISLLHMALTIGSNIVVATGTTQVIAMCCIPDYAPYLKHRKYLSCYFGDD